MTNEPLQPGSLLGPFELDTILGAGSFGTVYAAKLRENGRRVAVKVLHTHLHNNRQAYLRFIREAQTTAKVRHPNVVEVYFFGSEDGYFYFCMEFLDGEPFVNLIRRVGKLSPTETLRIMIPVMAAVAAIHEADLIHRDLKPGNIFLWKPTPGALHPKVLDFGIVKQLGEDLTVSGMALGTTQYMAPEQVLDSKRVGPSSDQWSLGVMVYEALSGVRLFQGGNMNEVLGKVLHLPIVNLRAHAPEIPAPLAAIVMRMLDRAPDGRFSSVKSAACALIEFADVATRKSYGRELGLADTGASSAEDGPEDVANASILAPEGSVEFLVPLDQIRRMRPPTTAPSFLPLDLEANRLLRRRLLGLWVSSALLAGAVATLAAPDGRLIETSNPALLIPDAAVRDAAQVPPTPPPVRVDAGAPLDVRDAPTDDVRSMDVVVMADARAHRDARPDRGVPADARRTPLRDAGRRYDNGAW